MEVDKTSPDGRDSMELESSHVAKDRTRKLDDSSTALAEKLLQGWTLLNEYCPQCLTPLVRDRQKRVFCAACKQWILTEAEATAKALQQRLDRVSAQDATEQSPATSTTQSPSSTSAGHAPPSPGQRGSGKGNGVNFSRLSLASLRAEDGKSHDGRNPKRFASSELCNESAARTVIVDGKENGTSRPGITAGLFQAPPHDPSQPTAPPQYSRPGLVLQPAVNPVNDILVARRTLTTLNEKLEGIRQLVSVTNDVNELRQLFSVLEECIHAIEITRQLLKSVE